MTFLLAQINFRENPCLVTFCAYLHALQDEMLCERLTLKGYMWHSNKLTKWLGSHHAKYELVKELPKAEDGKISPVEHPFLTEGPAQEAEVKQAESDAPLSITVELSRGRYVNVPRDMSRSDAVYVTRMINSIATEARR